MSYIYTYIFPCNVFDDSNRKNRLIISVTRDGRHILTYVTSSVWSPYMVESITQVESVQRALTIAFIPGLSSFSYVDRLQVLDLQTLEHRRLLADLLMCYTIIHGLVALNFDEFFSFLPNTTLRGHPYKCNRSKYFFSSRIVPIWNSLPVAVVMSKNVFSFKMSVRKFDLSRYLIVPSIIC